MVEILGCNLKRFFDTVDNPPKDAEIIYAGNGNGINYEVWEVSDELFKVMCNLSENEFTSLAGNDAWSCVSKGNVCEHPDSEFIVNGKRIRCWKGLCSRNKYTCLTEYLCDYMGELLPTSVCSCTVELAKYNDMKLSELFSIYEG